MERVNVRRLPDNWNADDMALLQAIDDATATPIYIAYRLADEWFDGVHGVLDDLGTLVARRPLVALALLEHVAIRLDRAQVDDSDGQMVEIFERVAPLHAEASAAAPETSERVAARLIELNALDIEPFSAVMETHGAVLGPEGLRTYRRLGGAL